MLFQIAEEDGNPNSEGCSYIHTHRQKVLAPSITPKSQSLTPPATATGFFHELPGPSTFLDSAVDSVKREIWGACSKHRALRYPETLKVFLYFICT